MVDDILREKAVCRFSLIKTAGANLRHGMTKVDNAL